MRKGDERNDRGGVWRTRRFDMRETDGWFFHAWNLAQGSAGSTPGCGLKMRVGSASMAATTRQARQAVVGDAREVWATDRLLI